VYPGRRTIGNCAGPRHKLEIGADHGYRFFAADWCVPGARQKAKPAIPGTKT
jgi:hypothetical protein